MATVDELQADLDAIRKARLDLAAGNRVDEVWRDGRRLVKGKVTLDGLTALIRIYEQDLDAAQAAEAGRPRRSAIGILL